MSRRPGYTRTAGIVFIALIAAFLVACSGDGGDNELTPGERLTL
jgi:hypothetical protein